MSTVLRQLTTKPRTMMRLSATEIVMEVVGPKCDCAFFPLTQENLRGRWDRARFQGETMHDAVNFMPNPIPGICLGVDPINKTVRRFDPMDTPEGHPFYLEWLEHQEKHSQFLAAMRPWDEMRQSDVSQTTIKTWLFWMRRIADGNLLVACTGSARLPTLREIEAMPGKTQIGQMNQYVNTPLYREHFDEHGTCIRKWDGSPLDGSTEAMRQQLEMLTRHLAAGGSLATAPHSPQHAQPQQPQPQDGAAAVANMIELLKGFKELGWSVTPPAQPSTDASEQSQQSAAAGKSPNNPAAPPAKGKDAKGGGDK